MDDEDDGSDGKSKSLERWRREKFLLARMERRQKQNELLPRGEVRVLLRQVALRFRQWGELMQRDFGSRGYQSVADCLRDIETGTERFFENYPEKGKENDAEE
jgi:hypothetical protein